MSADRYARYPDTLDDHVFRRAAVAIATHVYAIERSGIRPAKQIGWDDLAQAYEVLGKVLADRPVSHGWRGAAESYDQPTTRGAA